VLDGAQFVEVGVVARCDDAAVAEQRGGFHCDGVGQQATQACGVASAAASSTSRVAVSPAPALCVPAGTVERIPSSGPGCRAARKGRAAGRSSGRCARRCGRCRQSRTALSPMPRTDRCRRRRSVPRPPRAARGECCARSAGGAGSGAASASPCWWRRCRAARAGWAMLRRAGFRKFPGCVGSRRRGAGSCLHVRPSAA
jgi:hypothetical protein